MKKSKRKTILFVLLILLAASSCSPEISDIAQDPQKYRNEDLTLQGEVVALYSPPDSGLQIFKITDQIGAIWVISETKLPSVGETIKVTGRLQVNVNIQGEKFEAVLLDKTNED